MTSHNLTVPSFPTLARTASSGEKATPAAQAARWRGAADPLQRLLAMGGWKVRSLPRKSAFEADLLARRGKVSYAIELKAASEGRSDRLSPLLAQAVLQVMKGASRNALPLAVVSAPRIALSAAEQVLDFARQYVPEGVAVGVFDLEGLVLFRGPGLEALNKERSESPAVGASSSVREPRQLFSDLSQWMLKVLLANELPEHLLSAPRGQHRNAAQLAGAAQVSIRPCQPGESTDVLLRQAPAPESVFRGMISVDDVAASDVIQVWPSRRT